ncbi:MAG: hypothetical protein IJ449_09295 [Clostridia bacterium]|nr:hypothetical protein [Clostridia bacterium]
MMRMEPIEKWIWLPREQYPEHQTTALTISDKPETYAVAEVKKTFETGKAIRSAVVRFSADTAFVLYLDGKHLATGPSSIGGDFLFNDRVYPQQYATRLRLTSLDCPAFDRGTLDVRAMVKMQSTRMFEMSHGHGGFFFCAHVTFADGTKTVLLSDETWDIRYLGAYRPYAYDGTVPAGEWVKAENTANIWHSITSPLEPCTEFPVVPENNTVTVAPGETVECVMMLDKIYACYLTADVKTASPLHVQVNCFETDEGGSGEHYVFTEDTAYRGFDIHSAGGLRVKAENKGESPATLSMGIIATHYPVHVHAKTVTSDDDLNLVTDVCAHTLQYCRQTLHLDSPRHCEPMACTGDYYIEALMTQFTFGDQTLSAFDVRRTAQLLRYRDGRMFHTTYSLIWVQMLWDVYMLTGDKTLLSDCEDALCILLERFATYMGENGILEYPPDYMFIDWLYPDGINLHHPPKALGQSCLNMYYYGALRTAVKIYRELDEGAMARMNAAAAERLQSAVCALLYDKERGLFFEGLNTPTAEHLVNDWSMPKNIEKRYYRKHANILAAYFGIVDHDTAVSLLDKVMTDDSLGDVQPYFAHFLLDAVYRNGLREKYTRQILEQWVAPCKECPKGLAEGFIAPEGYHFDHSHAWGGTPAYALPLALSGLTILTPGYAKINLCPKLLGLDSAHVEIPTPRGMIVIDMKRDENGKQVNDFRVPDGVIVCDYEDEE